MLWAFLGAWAETAEIAGGTVTYTGATATTVDGDLGDIVIPAGRNVVIDLQGQTLTGNIVADGNVTILDSSNEKTGLHVGTLTENEGGNILPLTYASGNWIFGASDDEGKSAVVEVVKAAPRLAAEMGYQFASQVDWHDGLDDLATGVAAGSDRSYDYPSENVNIKQVPDWLELYNGPGESEVVWQKWCWGLIEAKHTNAGTYAAAGSTMVANPTPNTVNLNDLEFIGTVGANDTIVVPNVNGNVSTPYVRKNGRWGHNKKSYVNGRLRSEFVEDCEIAPGTGFWYERRAEGELKLVWPAWTEGDYRK